MVSENEANILFDQEAIASSALDLQVGSAL